MAALPKILNTPDSYLEGYTSKLAQDAQYLYDKIKDLRGISPIPSTAGMYMMTKINFDQFKPESAIQSDRDFVIKLWEEESCCVYPSFLFF